MIDYDISDHYPGLAIVRCDAASKGNKPYKFFRSFVNFHEKDFINALQTKN